MRIFFTILTIIIFVVSLDFFKTYSLYENKLSFIINGFDLVENAAIIIVGKLIVDIILALELPIAF